VHSAQDRFLDLKLYSLIYCALQIAE